MSLWLRQARPSIVEVELSVYTLRVEEIGERGMKLSEAFLLSATALLWERACPLKQTCHGAPATFY